MFTRNTVTIDEMVDRCGYGGHGVSILEELSGMDVTSRVADDEEGRAAVSVEVATEVVTAVLARIEWNNQKNEAYNAYVQRKAEEARTEREARWREEQNRAREQAKVAADAHTEAQRKKEAQEIAERIEAEHALKGAPVEFAAFDYPVPPGAGRKRR